MMAVYNQKNIFVIVWLSFPSVDSNFLSEAVRTGNVFVSVHLTGLQTQS